MPLQEHLKRSIEELQAQLEEEEGRNDELKAKIAELQDFIDEEKRRSEAGTWFMRVLGDVGGNPSVSWCSPTDLPKEWGTAFAGQYRI